MKLITKQLYHNEESPGIFEYLLLKQLKTFDYYVSGYASSTAGTSTTNFRNVYHYTEQNVDWWTNNIENQYFELFLHMHLALHIANYSFVTYGASYPKGPLPCGIVNWKITYFFKDKQVKEKQYHSSHTNVIN